jgi:septum formation protein
MRIILASKSPRRKEILENLGLQFEIIVADADEDCNLKDPSELVMTIATRKGRAVLESLDENAKSDTLLIACDTLVYACGEFLGKPRDDADAVRMLGMLSDDSHEVVSGLYLYYNGKEICRAESTKVFFDKMTENDIRKYIESGEPRDKAGAYAIQGKASAYINGIEGDYFNVVGLPAHLLVKTVKEEFGIDL